MGICSDSCRKQGRRLQPRAKGQGEASWKRRCLNKVWKSEESFNQRVGPSSLTARHKHLGSSLVWVKCKAGQGGGTAAVFSESVSEGMKSPTGRDAKGGSSPGEQDKRYGSQVPEGNHRGDRGLQARDISRKPIGREGDCSLEVP